MTKCKHYIGLTIVCLLAAGLSCGCANNGNKTDAENIPLTRFEGALIARNADGITVDAVSFHLFRIDMNGNVIRCDKNSDIIDTNKYFYFMSQTGDGKDATIHFPDKDDFTTLCLAYMALFGTEEDADQLFRFLSTYGIKPDVFYEQFADNPDKLAEIVIFWKYLHDQYLAVAGNESLDTEDVMDFLSFNEIKFSDFPSDPDDYFKILKDNNISFRDFMDLFFEAGDVPADPASSASAAAKYHVSRSQQQKLLAVKTRIENHQTAKTATAQVKTEQSNSVGGFILSTLAEIAIDTLVSYIEDVITGTPKQLTNFKEQPIDCYASTASGGIDKNSRYYSAGKVVKTDPFTYQYTQGALWWYNELNFTVQALGTVRNIYDGDHNGIDDGDIARWGIFSRQVTVTGTNVSANRVHDIVFKFKILDKSKYSIDVPAGGIDPADTENPTGFPTTYIEKTPGKTPAKFVIAGEIDISWKNRGFVGQAWQTDECRYRRKVYLDTVDGVRYDFPPDWPTSITLPIKYPCSTHWDQPACRQR